MQQENKSGAQPEEDGSPFDRALRVASHAALIVLAVLAGALLTATDIFPGPEVKRAQKAGRAVYDQLTKYDDVYKSDLWQKARGPVRGVTVHDRARSGDGFILYTSGHAPAAFLMDRDGQVRHVWQRPFSTVWDKKIAKVKRPQPDSHVFFRNARAFPNGDLLAIYEGAGDTPYGYGLVKLDRDSNVVWRYLEHVHHDLDVGPDGRVYVLTHQFDKEKMEGFDNLSRPWLDDLLVILSPDGKELKKISLTRVVARSRYSHLLHTVSSYAVGDPLHANAVEVITPERARNFAFGKAGQVLLSFRELGAIAVLDLESEELTWGARSYWIGQHDPDILADGNILLFDNYGQFQGPEGRSRVIEFDPRDMRVVWQYGGTREAPLESDIRSAQQRLDNGNTLIEESNGGRIVEVTREGQIVWEFVNPVSGGKNGDKLPVIGGAESMAAGFFDKEFREHIAGKQRFAKFQESKIQRRMK